MDYVFFVIVVRNDGSRYIIDQFLRKKKANAKADLFKKYLEGCSDVVVEKGLGDACRLFGKQERTLLPDVCRHCKKKKPVSGKRGLCFACYHKPGVREKYPSLSKYGQRGGV